jgi:hypothetical protein
MSAPTLPCPACGAPVVGAFSFISGRGLILDAAEGSSGYAVNPGGLASWSERAGRRVHDCGGAGFGVVVTVLRGVATVRAVDDVAERHATAALRGRLAGPVAALPVVLERLRAAGLTVHYLADGDR